MEKLYLVLHRDGDIFACSPEQIDHDNDKGAEYRLLRVDVKGRVYVSDSKLTYGDILSLSQE